MFGFKSLNEKKKRFHALEISATSAISVTVNLFQQYLPISTTIYIKGIVIIIRISLSRSIMSNTGSDRLVNARTDANGDSHICNKCDRRFRASRGLNQHVRS